MSAITATDARKALFPLIEQVNDDHTPVEIVSKKGNAILISKDDYDAMVETAYLLSSPANARRLLDSIEAVRGGHYQERELLE
ncbi:antitoxin YefM [Rhodococcus sp. 27YEA15]|uniref:type II toxin-antitoxin system Phd/YefM family antitoxin n=1 Tax=Rhodococcus sp. 27YEA15 TaxID=3156259 RepID=UPI003C7E7F9D